LRTWWQITVGELLIDVISSFKIKLEALKIF